MQSISRGPSPVNIVCESCLIPDKMVITGVPHKYKGNGNVGSSENIFIHINFWKLFWGKLTDILLSDSKYIPVTALKHLFSTNNNL